MTHNITKSKLIKLIASGHEQKALNQLIELAEFQNQETQQLIYLLSNRYKKLQKRLLIGNISSENASIRSADINYDLLNLIDQISFSKKEKSGDQNTSTKGSTSLPEMIKPILLVLALLASFFFFKDQIFIPEIASNQKSWLGVWNAEKMDYEKDYIPGKLEFYLEGNQWIGKYNKVNGSTDSLFNISFLEDGKKLIGNWKNSDYDTSLELDAEFELKGNFIFEIDVDDKNTFNGTYSNSYPKNSNKASNFDWNGKKQ